MTVWFMKVYTLDNKMRGKFMDKENLNSNKYTVEFCNNIVGISKSLL